MANILIRNGTLIDGNGGEPNRDAVIVVDGNRIESVGRAAPRQSPADMTVIDAGGGFILPGLIDTHVHVVFDGVNIMQEMVTPFSMRFYVAVQTMRNTLNAGITSVRDAGGADAGIKMAVEQSIIAGPRLQISINPMTITGGHGDGALRSGNAFNLFIGYPGFPDGVCDGVESVRRKVREMLRAGAEVIKIHATGGVLSPTDDPQFTQFSPDELAVIVQEAAFRKGVKVMAHAQGAEGVKNAIRAGIHSIEHGIFLDDEAIDLMVKHGTFLVPTLLAPIAVLEAGVAGGMPEYGIRKAREVTEIHSESIARAHKAGARIAMGTDAGVMRHGTNLRELGLMVNVGMTPMEAIVATTKTAAECLGWQDRVGTVEAGKLADIIIVGSDPLADIRSLEDNNNILLVMKDGRVVKDIRAA